MLETEIMHKTFTIRGAFSLICVFLLMQTTVQAQFAISHPEPKTLSQISCSTKITKEEMELLLKDANPLVLKQLAEDKEQKKQQIESVKQLLALACQAQKDA